MADRIPAFELHIRPLFRATDRDHMTLFFNLWDYDEVRKNAPTILLRLRNGMPPLTSGGPWPAEWVALFEHWMNTGYHRLLLGKGSAYQLKKSGSTYRLSCKAELPSRNSRVWFDIVDADPLKRSYLLYVEPEVPTPAPSLTSVAVFDKFDGPPNVSGVNVTDANGTTFVTIATA